MSTSPSYPSILDTTAFPKLFFTGVEVPSFHPTHFLEIRFELLGSDEPLEVSVVGGKPGDVVAAQQTSSHQPQSNPPAAPASQDNAKTEEYFQLLQQEITALLHRRAQQFYIQSDQPDYTIDGQIYSPPVQVLWIHRAHFRHPLASLHYFSTKSTLSLALLTQCMDLLVAEWKPRAQERCTGLVKRQWLVNYRLLANSTASPVRLLRQKPGGVVETTGLKKQPEDRRGDDASPMLLEAGMKSVKIEDGAAHEEKKGGEAPGAVITTPPMIPPPQLAPPAIAVTAALRKRKGGEPLTALRSSKLKGENGAAVASDPMIFSHAVFRNPFEQAVAVMGAAVMGGSLNAAARSSGNPPVV